LWFTEKPTGLVSWFNMPHSPTRPLPVTVKQLKIPFESIWRIKQ